MEELVYYGIMTNKQGIKYRRIFLFFSPAALAILLLSTAALAGHSFEEDYVWQEVYNERLVRAKSGDASAQYSIATMYEKGTGVKKNLEKAFHWFSKAADQGSNKAAFKMGSYLLYGKGVQKNFDDAYKWLRYSADKGNVRAFYALGDVYEKGHGVDKDLGQSLIWYNRAKDGGYIAADNRIAAVKMTIQELTRGKNDTDRQESMHEQENAPTFYQAPNEYLPISSVKSRLLAGLWLDKNKPAMILPSSVTRCVPNGRNIECTARGIKRTIGIADIRYTTKSVVHGIKDSGKFVISYRNNILNISITDKTLLKSGDKLPIKLGWQEKEHKLICLLRSNNELYCRISDLRDQNFIRQNLSVNEFNEVGTH